ncbi:hypothetical protein D3C80_2156260 [compost metagenome]
MVGAVQHGDEARRIHQHVGELLALGLEALVVGLDFYGPPEHLVADHGVQGGGLVSFPDGLLAQSQ